MATVELNLPQPANQTTNGHVPRLYAGDRLTQAEFERRYEAMPDVKKAELIEGVVYMPSPVSNGHSLSHFDIITFLGIYRLATPGVLGGDNGTVRLDLENVPQPDAFLRIAPEHGGRSRIDDKYIDGPPELIAEIAVSSVSYDLHDKLRAYQRNGVLEYMVWRVEDAAFDWFGLHQDRFERLPLSADGNFHSEVFPGLWIDAAALLRGDLAQVLAVLQRGIASPEHAVFVETLKDRYGRASPEPN